MKILYVHGVQYEGETLDQMSAREQACRDHNERFDAQLAEWERQRRTPMTSMIEWAKARGI